MSVSLSADSQEAVFDFQSLSVTQGENFHEECLQTLRYFGFEVLQTFFHLDDIGIELDALTENMTGLKMVWEFHGSYRGERPGLRRTDTVKKLIVNACLFAHVTSMEKHPFFVITSHLPLKGDARTMLDIALEKRLIEKVIHIRDEDAFRHLSQRSRRY